MARLLRSELFRLSRRLMPRVLILIQAGTVALLYMVLWTAVRAATEQDAPGQIEDLRQNLRIGAVRDFGLGIVLQVGTILAVILSASMFGTEYSWGTIRTLLPRARGRASFMAAKFISLGLFVVLIVLLGFVVAFVASALVTSAEGLQGGLGEQFWPHTFAAIGRVMYVMLPYVAIAAATTVWTRSTAAGIGVGLAMLIVEGTLSSVISAAGGPFALLPKVLPAGNVQAVLRANIVDPETSLSDTTRDLLSPWAAAGVLAAYTIGSTALAFWRFQTRDITSG